MKKLIVLMLIPILAVALLAGRTGKKPTAAVSKPQAAPEQSAPAPKPEEKPSEPAPAARLCTKQKPVCLPANGCMTTGPSRCFGSAGGSHFRFRQKC